MGKRKTKGPKPAAKKKQSGLATQFECLFCNHENSVTVKLEKKLGLGFLTCKVCGQTFQSTMNHLTQPVDIYYDWVDACEVVNKKYPNGTAPLDKVDEEGGDPVNENPLRAAMAKSRINNLRGDSYTNRGETDDFVVPDDDDAEGEFIEDD